MQRFTNVIEIRVIQRLLTVNPLLRIIHQQFLSLTQPSSSYRQQIQRLIIHSRHQFLQCHRRVHHLLRIPLRIGVQLGHRFQSGTPQLLEDDVTLVFLVLSRKERRSVEHFCGSEMKKRNTCENAATTPHVDTSVVAMIAQENVRRTVPQCDHLTRVRLDGNIGRTSQSIVTNLQFAVVCDEQILRFEVSVNHCSNTSLTCEECGNDDTRGVQAGVDT